MYSTIDKRYNIRYFDDEFNPNNTTNVKGIASYHRYDIYTANRPFLVSISVWATNMNLQKNGFLILPSIHKSLKFQTEDDFFSDAKITVEKASQKK